MISKTFSNKLDAQKFANDLRQTKLYSSVIIKQRQKTLRDHKGNYYSKPNYYYYVEYYKK